MSARVVPISISMSPQLARRIRVLAAQEDKSRSRFICEVLEWALTTGNIGGQARSEADEGPAGEVCDADH